MRVVCVGGGPAGLYFAILMKLADSQHEVTVLERKPVGSRDGWGVVFWDDLLDDLRATDPESAQRILDGTSQWHGQRLERHGTFTEPEGSGYSIERSTLLDILAARAAELGVIATFDHDVAGAAELSGADVVVASDGANSTLRRLEPDRFKTEVGVGRNKYLWLGTARVFDSFTFIYVNTPSGWIWCHTYTINEHTSTFIVECPPQTWAGLGFDTLMAPDGLRVLEEIFSTQLDGARLRSLGRDDAVLPWLNFRTVTNERWHSGNTVLLGDAAHTTHFSIGSGTRLALQDAIALAAALRAPDAPQLAFASYEQQRRAELRPAQADARFSAQWFENVDRYIGLPGPEFFFFLETRRDPWIRWVPLRLYYRTRVAAERVTVLRSLRAWVMPKARALSRRRP